MSVVARSGSAASPAAVHVHPKPVTLADVGDGVKRIVGAQHRCSCSRVHVERLKSLKMKCVRIIYVLSIGKHLSNIAFKRNMNGSNNNTSWGRYSYLSTCFNDVLLQLNGVHAALSICADLE